MRTSGNPISSFSPHIQAQITAQLHGGKAQRPDTKSDFKKIKPRLRQNSKGLNKTEAAFLAWLTVQSSSQAHRTILEQAITLRLGNGVRYTPDFFRPSPDAVFYEVKGFMRDDAAVKIKVAATLFPWWRFYLVTKRTKRQGGGWQIDRVLP